MTDIAITATRTMSRRGIVRAALTVGGRTFSAKGAYRQAVTVKYRV